MSQKELKEYFDWFLKIIPRRISELNSTVRRSHGFEHWKADYSPSSLESLGKWFATQIVTRRRSRDEINRIEAIEAESPFPVPVPRVVLSEQTLSLAMDLGVYLSQVFLKNHPTLKWDQSFGSKRYVDYGQPVLSGFADSVPLNPLRMTITFANGILLGSRLGQGLIEIYDRKVK